jgi:hypothetical protein
MVLWSSNVYEESGSTSERRLQIIKKVKENADDTDRMMLQELFKMRISTAYSDSEFVR